MGLPGAGGAGFSLGGAAAHAGLGFGGITSSAVMSLSPRPASVGPVGGTNLLGAVGGHEGRRATTATVNFVGPK